MMDNKIIILFLSLFVYSGTGFSQAKTDFVSDAIFVRFYKQGFFVKKIEEIKYSCQRKDSSVVFCYQLPMFSNETVVFDIYNEDVVL